MIYNFVIISGEVESFIREFQLSDTNTLLDFHMALQEELEYDKSQMSSFFTSNENWEKEEEFTLFDMGSNTTAMEDVTIDDILIIDNQKLLYIFDLFNERAFFIECIGPTDEIEGREYPICTQSKGRPPKQVVFSDFTHVDLPKLTEDEDEKGMDDQGDLPDIESIENIDDL